MPTEVALQVFSGSRVVDKAVLLSCPTLGERRIEKLRYDWSAERIVCLPGIENIIMC